jgi:hypothetical protein
MCAQGFWKYGILVNIGHRDRADVRGFTLRSIEQILLKGPLLRQSHSGPTATTFSSPKPNVRQTGRLAFCSGCLIRKIAKNV